MALPRFEVDPDVARARTPPAALYTSPEVLARLRERVFPAAWQWLDVPPLAPSSAAPCEPLEGFLDAPLVVTRDADGVERCLSNVCTHRAAVVCVRAGSTRGLRCGYHGRSFGLDGVLRAAPGFEGAPDFPGPDEDLRAVPLRRLGPLAFARLAGDGRDDEDFAGWIRPALERLGGLPLGAAHEDPGGRRVYELDANWALYCENYLEGLHIPYVHGGLNEVLDFERYELELFERAVLQVGLAREGEATLALPTGHPDAGKPVAGLYLWLFPNLMLNAYPWGLSLNQVVPLAPRRTRVVYRRWVWDEELLASPRGAGADLHRVELEDDAVVESVQRGVDSRLYRRGRYAPRHERGTHHLHRLLAAALAREEAG